MFHMPQSRTEVIKLGIKVLEAQERHFRTLNVQHHKLYALAFFTLEAATAIMVVFIAYPSENGELFEEAMSHIKDGIARMNIILNANPLARPAKDLIELLMLRAEKLHKSPSASSPPSHPTLPVDFRSRIPSHSPVPLQQNHRIPCIRHPIKVPIDHRRHRAILPNDAPTTEIKTRRRSRRRITGARKIEVWTERGGVV